MVPQPYIGVTGITSLKDVKNMQRALDRAEENVLGMYGILMNGATLYEKTHRGRWAKIEDVPELMKAMPKESLKAVHWCADELKYNELSDVMRSTNFECTALQLNMSYPSLDELTRFRKDYTNVRIIFQIEKEMLENPLDMKKKIEPYVNLVDYLLVDQSMGGGIPIDPKVSSEVAEALMPLERGIVFAGGLNSMRVKEIAPLIRKFNASIDAESRLMNDEDKLDNLKVGAYIIEGLRAMGQAVK